MIHRMWTQHNLTRIALFVCMLCSSVVDQLCSSNIAPFVCTVCSLVALFVYMLCPSVVYVMSIGKMGWLRLVGSLQL